MHDLLKAAQNRGRKRQTTALIWSPYFNNWDESFYCIGTNTDMLNADSVPWTFTAVFEKGVPLDIDFIWLDSQIHAAETTNTSMSYKRDDR